MTTYSQDDTSPVEIELVAGEHALGRVIESHRAKYRVDDPLDPDLPSTARGKLSRPESAWPWPVLPLVLGFVSWLTTGDVFPGLSAGLVVMLPALRACGS